MKEWIEAVKACAVENYEVGGWDYVIECYEDDDIEEIIVKASATTLVAAIEAVGDVVGTMNDYRADIIGYGGEGW